MTDKTTARPGADSVPRRLAEMIAAKLLAEHHEAQHQPEVTPWHA